jgi:Transcriptional regulators
MRCGVSMATVSKALNGRADISSATRLRIHQVAQEMGYMPNSAARALKTNRTYNLGVLFVDETHSGLTHEYFSSILESFKEEAEQFGYDVTFIHHNIGKHEATYLEHCRYRNVDGVAIASVDFSDPQVVELVNSDIPIVTIDHVFNNRTAILSNNVQGMRDLTAYVLQRGHRQIAFIHGENTAVTENRLASFYKTCLEFGVDIPDSYIREARYHDPQSTAIQTRALLGLPKRPTCILFPDDFSYIGGMNVILEAGLSIPFDISVAGYDGIYLSQVLSPRLTTLQQRSDILGKTVAQRLVALIEHPKTALPEQIVVQGKLLEGASVSSL